MKDRLNQIMDIARDIRLDIYSMKIGDSKKSSLMTLCQSIIDDAYLTRNEIERATCAYSTQEISTTQAESTKI